jgi:ribosomal protein S5
MKTKRNFFRALYKALFSKESAEEIAKDKEIQWESEQWGNPNNPRKATK